ncbi:MAG: hypothetical protein L3K16_06155 [Thermoplasmata archaeon]|nr:hypothetical protein [Thermoplasmata archaeon]
MFELTKAAAAKAREHLAGSQLLAKGGYYADAYFLAAIALEELAIAGIRLLTESGIIDWKDPPVWWHIRERDLASGGMHLERLRIGLTIASMSGMLDPSKFPPMPDDPREFRSILLERSAGLRESITRMLRNPAIVRVLREGQRRKEAALYSTPKPSGGQSSSPPTADEYLGLASIVSPLLEQFSRTYPSDEEFAKIAPIAHAIFRGDRESFDEALDGLMREPGDKPREGLPEG